MDIIEPLAQAYAEHYSSPLGDLLQEIASYTEANHPEAHMLSGSLQGKYLEMMSCLLQPRRILEVGTFMGYSALCLAAGLPADGRLHTIELRDVDADRAEGYFQRSAFASQIVLHRGNALEIISTLSEDWDLVFIDADKPGYIDYYNLVLPRLRKGGLIIADNVLFHGQVLDAFDTDGSVDGTLVKGKSAKAIQAFNEMIGADERVDKVMVTLRDGLFLIRKK